MGADALFSFPFDTSMLVSLAVLVGMLGQARLFQRKLNHMAQHHAAKMQASQTEIHALLSSAEGMGEKLNQLEQRLRQLEQRQDQISMKEPSEQIYSHALRMVRHGEDISTVMERSGISRGEAELLQLLNGMNPGRKGDKSAA